MKLSTLKLSIKNLKWNIEITFGYALASILYYLFQKKEKKELDCNYSALKMLTAVEREREREIL